jgi:hypothetical protein
MPRKGDCTLPNGTGAALDEKCSAAYRAGDVHGAVGSDARDAEAGALLERHAVRQRHGLVRWDDSVVSGRPERAVALRPETPHTLANARCRHLASNLVDNAGSIAVWNYPRIRHANPELIVTLLNVARIDAGGGDANANLVRPRFRSRHLAYDKNLCGRALPFVPGCSHGCFKARVVAEA